MIKIQKDLTAIPNSLNPVPNSLRGHDYRKATTTHTRRMEVITAGNYTDQNIYNSRYKLGDIKSQLDIIYSKKCAYCESGIEERHVEHYRPKRIYYWLAYSWDNLLIACSKCNGHKLSKFELSGIQCYFTASQKNIEKINNLSRLYDRIEKPKFVNPEVFDPYPHLVFCENGEMSSTHENVDYTITNCQLNRTYLKDKRRKIIDDFKSAAEAEIAFNDTKYDQIVAIRALIREFIRLSKNQDQEFLAFRKYHLEHKTLNRILNRITTG